MRPRSATYPFCVFAALALATAARADVAFMCFPANNATRVSPDTHLVLTFSSPPTLGKSGLIRIYDAGGHHLVDTLDLSIPAGPDPSRRIAAPPAGMTVLARRRRLQRAGARGRLDAGGARRDGRPQPAALQAVLASTSHSAAAALPMPPAM